MKFKACISVTTVERVEIEVNADCVGAAREACHTVELLIKLRQQGHVFRDVVSIEQVDGPFFYMDGYNDQTEQADPWYDLHEPGDVIVLSTKVGKVWTQALTELMVTRLAQIGLTLVDRWNGWVAEGNASPCCSFRVSGRKGPPGSPMSAADKAILLADPPVF